MLKILLIAQTGAQTTTDVQKQYLAGVQYLFEQGLVSIVHTTLQSQHNVIYLDHVWPVCMSTIAIYFYDSA